MIFLRISMQGEDIFEHTNDKCHVFIYFSMQDEDILEHTNDKFHLCTLYSTCRPLCNIGMHAPHDH